MPDMTSPTIQMLKKAIEATSARYQTIKRNKVAAGVAAAEKEVEAAKKGLFSLAKHKTGKLAGTAFKGLGIYAGATSAYEVLKAAKNEGLAEGGKEALKQGAFWAPQLAQIQLMKGPHIAKAIGGAWMAYDILNMAKGNKTSSDVILENIYEAYPNLQRKEEDGMEFRTPSEAPAPFSDSQPQLMMPSDAEVRRIERRNNARIKAYQSGREVLDTFEY